MNTINKKACFELMLVVFVFTGFIVCGLFNQYLPIFRYVIV